jgi:hypothetical protein
LSATGEGPAQALSTPPVMIPITIHLKIVREEGGMSQTVGMRVIGSATP